MFSFFFQEMMCQLTSASQSAFVFFSSFSVVLIAVDRLLLIVYPRITQISTCQVRAYNYLHYINFPPNMQAFNPSAFGALSCAAFSMPLFFFTKIQVIFKDASYCYEVSQPYIEHVEVNVIPSKRNSRKTSKQA